MKRTSSEKPITLSWCITVRNCGHTLEATLKSLRARTPEAEIVVVDTMSSDNTAEIAKKYADVFEEYTGPRGTWDREMYAVDSMCDARNYTFSLASGRWRAWADGDDVICGGEEAERYLRLNGLFREPSQPAKQKGFKLQKGPAELEAEETGNVALATKPVGLEDWLRFLEEHDPEATIIWCPYLYQRDSNDYAVTVQTRERIVRWDNPPKFHWQEPAHEILVPIDNYHPKRTDLPNLLWVHEKKFTGEEYEYSLKRHSAIMVKQHDAGDVTYRRCRYLANFANRLFPERELEFLNAGLEVAWTTLDRYRALIDLGTYYARRGQLFDSYERHSAATAMKPELPDAWYAGAQVAWDNEDWIRSITYFQRGVACGSDGDLSPESEVNPRDQVVKFPTLLSLALQKAGDQYIKQGLLDNATAVYEEAAKIAERVTERAEVGEKDKFEAYTYFVKANNKYMGHRAVLCLKETWEYLMKNDESQKALALLEAFPHNAEDHPVKITLERDGAKVRRHINDPKAYLEFYNSSLETGYVPMYEENYKFENSHARVKWLVDTIARLLKERVAERSGFKPMVLDVGCCDGIVGIPLLEKLSEGGHQITYNGYDMCREALDGFREWMKEHPNVVPPDVAERVVLVNLAFPPDNFKYDFIIAGEIIEHVPDPVAWLKRLRSFLVPGGQILVTTPWGSFDEGHPPEKTSFGTPRDNRGHLRAYAPHRAYEEFKAAGYRVDELAHIASGVGDAMVIFASDLGDLEHTTKAPIAVAVAGALWEWNGSLVDRDGIGASEEMIVRLGEYQAGGAGEVEEPRDFTVFGPVPTSEVCKKVAYFPREGIRRWLPGRDGKIVVSRAPGFYKQIDEARGDKVPMVLWLQDTTYPDLDQEAADRYDNIICVSSWHKRLTIEHHGLRPDQEDKIVVAYNFVQKEHFVDGIRTDWKSAGAEKLPHHFIYASSPDRGLIKLLQLWPRVLEHYPDATLSIFYGWKGAAKLGGGADATWNKRYLTARREYERLRFQKGVTEVGLVNHYRIAVEFQKASVWGYSTSFHETGCLSAAKARAAGAVPVTSALAALNETGLVLGGSLGTLVPMGPRDDYGPDYDDQWIEGVRAAIEGTTLAQRKAMAEEALELYSYETIRKVWDRVLG